MYVIHGYYSQDSALIPNGTLAEFFLSAKALNISHACGVTDSSL